MKMRSLASCVAVGCSLWLAACGSSSSGSSSASSASSSTASASPEVQQDSGVGYEGMPLEQGPYLASPATTQSGEVDGISCGPTEQLLYHIHIHLEVWVDGRLYAIPAGVGIPGSQSVETNVGPVAEGGRCLYWLHTHTADGVIHVESPLRRIYTLGNFFDVWHQSLSAGGVASATGKVTAFFNGKLWSKDPRLMPLIPHAVIQLEIGLPPPPLQTVDWSHSSL